MTRLKCDAIRLGLLMLSLGGALTTSRAWAEVVENDRFLVPSTDISCNGETVTVTGEAHFVVMTAPGGFEVQNNAHLSGVGPSGTKYEFVSNEKQSIVVGSIVAHAKTRLISQGASDNLFVATTFTSPPPVFTFEPECRG